MDGSHSRDADGLIFYARQLVRLVSVFFWLAIRLVAFVRRHMGRAAKSSPKRKRRINRKPRTRSKPRANRKKR